MSRAKGAPLRAHLIALVLAAALPSALLQAWTLHEGAKADEQNAREQVLHLAQITAAQTARFLGQAHNIVNGFAARPEVRALDASRCGPLFADFLSLAPRFANVVTMAPDGRFVCSGVPLARGARGDPERLLSRLRGPEELTVGVAAPGVITGKWVVPVGRPLLDADGAVVGAVALTLDLATLPLLSGLEALSASAVVGIGARDGTVLAHSADPARFVGTNPRPGRPVLSGGSGTLESVGLDGVLRIQGFTPIPGTDWVAVASLPAAEVYAPARRRALNSLLIGIAVLAAALLLAARIGRRIAEPVAALGAAVRATARAPAGGPREIDAVAGEFNRMLDRLAHDEAALRDSRTLLHAIVEGTTDAVFAKDAHGRYILVNDAAARILGKPRDEILGRDDAALFSPEEAAQFTAADRRVVAEQRVMTSEDTLCAADGSRRAYLTTKGPLRDGRGARASGVFGISRDITARKHAEQALEAERRRLRDILNSMSVFVALFSLDGRLLDANQAPLRFVGARREDVVGTDFAAAAWWPDDAARDTVRAAMRRAAAGETVRVDLAVAGMSGETRFLDAIFAPLRDARGEVVETIASGIDVTERKAAEEAERESERQLATLVANLPGLVYRCRNDSRYTTEYVSEGAQALSGYPAEDFRQQRRQFADLIEEADRAPVWDAIQAALAEGLPFELVYRIRDASGALKWVWERGRGVYAPDGRLQALEGFVTDVTDRRRAEESLRELSRRITRVQEDERRRIALALHDDVGQALTAVRLNLQAVRRTRSAPARREALADGLGIVDEAIERVRSMSLDLRPQALDDLGLASALGVYCERQAERAGVAITLEADPGTADATGDAALACYRIAQEAVTNALRHAAASRIRVTLERRDGRLVLQVADDGGGFDAGRPQGAIGLLGMRERAELAGGMLAIQSRPGDGTRVRAEFADAGA